MLEGTSRNIAWTEMGSRRGRDRNRITTTRTIIVSAVHSVNETRDWTRAFSEKGGNPAPASDRPIRDRPMLDDTRRFAAPSFLRLAVIPDLFVYFHRESRNLCRFACQTVCGL